MENGGPAPEGVTDKIYENSTTIKEYLIAEDLPDVFFLFLCMMAVSLWWYLVSDDCYSFQVDISKIGSTSFSGPDGEFEVEIFDSTDTYVKLMK